jgi:hypothetical protein
MGGQLGCPLGESGQVGAQVESLRPDYRPASLEQFHRSLGRSARIAHAAASAAKPLTSDKCYSRVAGGRPCQAMRGNSPTAEANRGRADAGGGRDGRVGWRPPRREQQRVCPVSCIGRSSPRCAAGSCRG